MSKAMPIMAIIKKHLKSKLVCTLFNTQKNLAIDYAMTKFGMEELSLERKELITKKEISYDDIKQTQKGLER